MLATAEYELFVDGAYSDALDLYMALSDIVSYANERDKATKSTIMAIQESLARVLTLNFKDYDLPKSAWDEEKREQRNVAAVA